MLSFFNRSKAGDYKEKASGFMALLRADSLIARIVIFIAMSVVFFGILKITERKIPTGMVPDSTDADTSKPPPAIHRAK